MWSTVIEVILTTLRYLAPATILTIFWGQQSFLFKLLKHIDSAFRAIVFSSEEQKQAVLKWLSESGPVEVEDLNTVWHNGWIVCGVLDAVLPGACAGHLPTKLPLKHAQAIADHYLGVEPIFSRQELESNDSLSRHQEWKLATYLDRIRLALTKITPPVSKQITQRTSSETSQFILDYVAKGSGLAAAQLNNKAHFKIYSTSQQSLDPGEVNVLIKGPKDTYGMVVLPPILCKSQVIRQKLLGMQSKSNYTENALPLTQGAMYLRYYGKNNMSKTYYVPKTKYDIDIEVETNEDHAKISYTVKKEGRYEITITSRGHHIVGSPFSMKASYNIIDILENENSCLEDGEQIDIVDVKTDRKVVLRIVDFVTEKMLLKENGSLEKISEAEAKMMMTTDNFNINTSLESLQQIKNISEKQVAAKNRFRKIVQMVIKLNKLFNHLRQTIYEKQAKAMKDEKCSPTSRSQQDIPDIVNSTINETKIGNPFISSKKQNKVIIPENISVSLCTERAHEKGYSKCEDIFSNIPMSSNEQRFDIQNSNNPFLNETFEDCYEIEKELGSFVNTKYETNKESEKRSEEIQENRLLKIILDDKEESINNNQFIKPDVIHLERPKTPILKIISGEITDRPDSLYFNPTSDDISETSLESEFTNPFWTHQHCASDKSDINLPVLATDFIIGAPVSLPPIIKAPSPEPQFNSLIENTNDNKVPDSKSCLIPTSLGHSSYGTTDDRNTFVSLDSAEEANDTPKSSLTNVQAKSQNEIYSPKKDFWDSAYVSIDDINSSPDNNNNENNEMCESPKQKYSYIEGSKPREIANMGPAEREIWQSELNNSVVNINQDSKLNKADIKRPTFTPIFEENERSISTSTKEIIKPDARLKQESEDQVTVAFAELNDIFLEYNPKSDTMKDAINDNSFISYQNMEITEYDNVDSASELTTDVKRHIPRKPEGAISEVQANVTESVSASQILRINDNDVYNDFNSKTQFKNDSQIYNIVLEKKKYWDDKIRQIESEENKVQIKKKRLSSKHQRHNDSLTKRKGKQIVKNFLNAGGNHDLSTNKESDIPLNKQNNLQSEKTCNIEKSSNHVDEWKKYWDDKLENEKAEKENVITTNKTKGSVKDIHNSQLISSEFQQEDTQYDSFQFQTLPVKHELSEEVFKAFEISPKRFFGTSRKQILSKIDSFLGKPKVADGPKINESGINQESGLVSSRISLFHTISKTEELSSKPKTTKCSSLHNLYENKKNKPENLLVNTSSISNNLNVVLNSNTIEINSPVKENTLIEPNKDPNKNKEVISPNSLDICNTRQTSKIFIKKPLTYSRTESSDKISNDIRRKPISKSELNIFSKAAKRDESKNLDKCKSCEELPKFNVRNFISLYENVTKTAESSKPVKMTKRKLTEPIRVSTGAVNRSSSSSEAAESIYNSTQGDNFDIPKSQKSVLRKSWASGNIERESMNRSIDTDASNTSMDIEIVTNQDSGKQTTYLSCSDIELEIIENIPEKSVESSPERDVHKVTTDYKSRFKMAKQFFQSLEELRDNKKSNQLNECEILLYISTESLKTERPQKRVKKNIKSRSMPSSEISKLWDQYQDEEKKSNDNKLVKISEKFNVDDLFNDVMEGRLSRQGSLRGIPHKKAVLETFRSMENISDTKLSSYEIAVSQLNEFARENHIKNAQTYLSEYPYLPTTNPSKYHSRLDVKASGLITMKELLDKKPRRNSVPDLRLNPNFTVDV